jgi:hypothetical protein
MRIIERLKGGAERFAARHLSGSVEVGPLTLNGANALHWMAELRVPALGVTLCARPSAPSWINGRPWYFYASPNRTPWAAVLACGPGIQRDVGERIADRLNVLADSPRPETEAEKIWALWGPKPKVEAGGAGTPPAGDSGSPTISSERNTRLRRFTYPNHNHN